MYLAFVLTLLHQAKETGATTHVAEFVSPQRQLVSLYSTKVLPWTHTKSMAQSFVVMINRLFFADKFSHLKAKIFKFNTRQQHDVDTRNVLEA